MKLEHPFLQLPVSFDAAALAREIEVLGESVWRPHPQGYAGNTALPLISVDGDPASDAVRGAMRPTPHLLACPYLMQVLQSLGAVWGRTRLMRLAGQAEVTPHVDINYYWREHMRIHVPIVTQPTVRFHCDDAVVNMRPGECWTFDTWRLHKVHNDDHRARIHLVADTVGGPGFWALLRNARRHDQSLTGWAPRHVPPTAAQAALEFESFNLPTVMSPWELREHVRFIVGEAVPCEELAKFEQSMSAHARDWQALWAKHGDSGHGLDEYRALRDRMQADAARHGTLQLRNGVTVSQAMQNIVTANLLAAAPAGGAAARTSPGTQSQAVAAPMAAMTTPRMQFNFGPMKRPTTAVLTPQPPAVRFDRPVIVVSTPRSGSTLLFETLAKAPGLHTIGRESHQAIEGLRPLNPSANGFHSNRLGSADATPAVIEAIHRNFAQQLRDREGRPPPQGSPVRLLEKTPKNALRIPFLRAVFPDARFIYLYRDPRSAMASMMEAWHSGRFVTYPDLPGWQGLPWSLLLVPGWRDLIGRPLEEIVAAQWQATTMALVEDLRQLPPGRVTCVRYDTLIAQPQAEVERLCRFMQLDWDLVLADLPLSRYTVTPPDPSKWRRYETEIQRVLPQVQRAQKEAEAFLA